MSVRILELGQVPDRQLPQVVAFDLSINDPPLDPEFVRWEIAQGAPYAPYVTLFAEEAGQLLARVSVYRPGFRTAQGLLPMSGVTDVVTRPEAVGRGLAERLLREAHRRERAAGFPWILLWTQRSWGAHRLYEKLGYRDVFSPPVAVRRIGSRARPPAKSAYSTRPARPRDADLLGGLLATATRNRLGFAARYPGSYRMLFDARRRAPEAHHLLLLRNRAVGFFYAPQNPRQVSVSEAVVIAPDHVEPLLDAMERLARGRWLSITSTTFARDAALALERRGFASFPSAHGVLMAKRLAPAHPDGVLDSFADPRFHAQRGDIF